jgi:hypothetical protein
MLKIIQLFGKHCSCYLQGKYVMVGHFWQPYVGQTAGEEMDLMMLIRGVEERAAIHQLPALHKTAKNAQPLHIHPEDGKCNVSRNG